jgi:hypothetical protein
MPWPFRVFKAFEAFQHSKRRVWLFQSVYHRLSHVKVIQTQKWYQTT